MPDSETDWERASLPTLKWVRDKPLGFTWEFDRSEEPLEEVPELSGTELDATLRRLEEHGLVAAQQRQETVGRFYWTQLRVTPDGLRILGDWPTDLRDQLDSALPLILNRLADETPDEEQAKSFRRAAGAVGKFGAGVLKDVFMSEVKGFGGDLGS